MSAGSEERVPVPTLDSVLDRFVDSAFSAEDREQIQAALVSREDDVADFLRMAGRQFGLYPQIVAEVLAETGIGSAPTPEVREMIHRQFHELMAQVAAAQRGEGPMPQP